MKREIAEEDIGCTCISCRPDGTDNPNYNDRWYYESGRYKPRRGDWDWRGDDEEDGD